jgi:hypothetical protein
MYKPNIEKVNGVHIGITPSDATNPIPSPQDIEKSINNFLINPSNRGKKVVLLIQTENPLGCSPTEEWAKSVAEVMKNIWKKHGENSLVGIGDGIYDGLSEGGKYYDVADYLPKLDKFVKLKSGAKTFGDVGGPRPGALITENKALLQVLAEQQFIELLSANGEGQWIMAKMMELEVDPKNREQVSEYFEKNTELCLKLGLEMSKKLGLKTSMFEPYEKMKEQGAYRKGGFYLWGNLTEAVSGLQIPESMHEIAGSKTIDCATTWTRLLMNGHLMEGVRKAVVTTPVEDFIVDPKDLIDPASGKYRIEGRFSTSAIRETFRDSFETMERAVCTLLVYNIDKGHPVPDFAKAPQVQAYIREVASRTNAIDKAIQTNPSLQKMQQEMRGEAEKSMNSISWKTAPKMIEAEIDAKAKMVRGDSVRTM